MPPGQGCRKGGLRPFTPEDHQNLAIPYFRNGSVCIEFGTVENLLILNSHFRGCMQVHGYHPGNHPSGSFQLCSSAILACESGVTSPCGL
jgi:hypothetical protein